jgi:hypothetical protein
MPERMKIQYGERFPDGPGEWMMDCAADIIGKDSPALEIFCYFWHEVVYEYEGVMEQRKKEKKNKKNQKKLI